MERRVAARIDLEKTGFDYHIVELEVGVWSKVHGMWEGGGWERAILLRGGKEKNRLCYGYYFVC